MKIYEKVQYVETRDKLVRVECDVCKSTIPEPAAFDICEIEVRSTIGNHYPEGGLADVVTFDLCPACFVEHVVQHLESLGATPRRAKIDT